jgi:hypothetical protein
VLRNQFLGIVGSVKRFTFGIHSWTGVVKPLEFRMLRKAGSW